MCSSAPTGACDTPQRGQTLAPRVLLIPGLDGDPSLVRAAAAHLFPGMHVLPFGHRTDAMGDGVDGLADRALATLDGDGSDAPTFVCGESFGGMVALTLARRHPSRVRGLILLSAFGRYPLLNSWSGRLSLRVWRMLGTWACNACCVSGASSACPARSGWCIRAT